MNEHTPTPESPHPTLHPRVWIGSLADYNAGRLVGDWVDAAVSDDELVDAVQRVLATSQEPSAEEWGIFDYDEFGAFRLNEYEDLGVVAAVARGIVEHGPAFAAWADRIGGDLARLDGFADAFLGEFESAAAYAESVLEDYDLDQAMARALPEWLRPYVSIDTAGVVRDLTLSGDIDIEQGSGDTVWVFDGHA